MVDISICMVSMNCRVVLEACLRSLRTGCSPNTYEVIIVDNASSDGTPEWLQESYPDVRVIRNMGNVGFTKGTNQAIEVSSGRYILWLNTDTVLEPHSLAKLVEFLEGHPKAGIVGPRVLNRDGSFQPQCRRGNPTLVGAIGYFSGIYKFLPNNRRLGEYLLAYLPVDQSTEVVAVSGCCLLARREVWSNIGPLDEAIFGFGEDIEWCFRARQAGWQVWYHAASEIMHLKGQGGVHSAPLAKVWGIHQAMWVFFYKHLRREHQWWVIGVVWAGIWGKFVISATYCLVRRTLKV